MAGQLDELPSQAVFRDKANQAPARCIASISLDEGRGAHRRLFVAGHRTYLFEPPIRARSETFSFITCRHGTEAASLARQ
jgi:hypothetical protein